jgi:dihydrofolate reductase
MKRLILQMQMSVDGFVSGADPGLDWTLWDWGPDCPWDEALKRRFNETLAQVDTVLLSGPMAPPYIAHWTQMARQRAGDPDYAFTERVVAAQKRVISQSLDAIDQPRTTIGRGSLRDEVTALKQQPGGDIICFGGVSFGAGLLEADLVDELQFYVNPYAIRAGRSIFRQPRRLQCIDATAYPCGMVVQRYRPA